MLKYKLLPFLIAAAFGGVVVVQPARADSIQSASASGKLDGSDFTGSPINLPGTVPGSVDLFASPVGGAGSSGFFHTYGSVDPGSVFFGSRTSGTGVYELLSPYNLTQEFTLAAPGSATFSFVVDNGELSVHCSPCTGGGSAMYTIDLKIDGSSVAGGTGLLTVADDGSTLLTHSGLALDGLAASGTATGAADPVFVDYGWSPTAFTISLGLLSAGAHTLSYDLITQATGAFASDTVCGYGGVLPAAFGGGEGGCGLGNTTARSGDPFNFPNGPAGSGLEVPEPGTLALLGLGLAAAAGLRRRRNGEDKSGG